MEENKSKGFYKMDTEKNNFRMSHALTRASKRLNLAEMRIVYAALNKCNRQLGKNEQYVAEVSVHEIAAIAPQLKLQTIYSEMSNIEQTLFERKISWNDKDGWREAIRWVSGVKYKKGLVVMRFDSSLNEHFSDLKLHTGYSLEQAAHFGSAYTWGVWELLAQFKSTGLLRISVSDFKFALSIEPNQYKNFPDLYKRVIKKAIEEIEEKNKIKIKFNKIKDGRTIKTLEFKFLKNFGQPQKKNPGKQVGVSSSKPIDDLRYEIADARSRMTSAEKLGLENEFQSCKAELNRLLKQCQLQEKVTA